MAAASITRSTAKTWETMGLLPAPLKISLGMGGGVFNRYPAWAVERARFIAEKRAAGFTYDEVRAMLAKMEAQEGRKGNARPEQAEPATTAVKRSKSTAKTARAGRGGRR